MACCHSLTFIKDDLVGDPLEMKMFNSTSWILDETGASESVGGNSPIGMDDIVLAKVIPPPSQQGNALSIIRRFDFESKLQRMSVVVKHQTDRKYSAFVKGSPEKIASLCCEESLPQNYHHVLASYT